jgi:hypothetical protein
MKSPILRCAIDFLAAAHIFKRAELLPLRMVEAES